MNDQQNLYAIFDSKACHYHSPISEVNDATAIRSLVTAIKQEGHPFGIHAHDYTLWRIGTFDSATATIAATKPEMIANAHELKAQMELNLVQGGE